MLIDGIVELMSWDIVIMNSLLLFSTGWFGLLCHLYIGYTERVWIWMTLLSIYSCCFLLCQCIEFTGNMFIFTGVCRTFLFYLITGLHGSHLVCGLLFLRMSLSLQEYIVGLSSNFVGFSLLYWHLVDTVWICLLMLVYEFGWSCLLDMM